MTIVLAMLAALQVPAQAPQAQGAAVNPAPGAVALALDVVRQMRMRDSLLASLPVLKPLIGQQVLALADQPGSPFAAYASDPAKKQHLATLIGDEYVKAFGEQIAAFEEGMAQAYARRMSVNELTALLGFLRTTAGARWAAAQPDLSRDGQQLGAQIGAAAGIKAVAAALARAKVEIK